MQVIDVRKLPFDTKSFTRGMRFAVARLHEAEMRAEWRTSRENG